MRFKILVLSFLFISAFPIFGALGQWQLQDLRIDLGDPAGANDSWNPQISTSGNNVYVTWEDTRNGWADIYFNCSTDGGVTWQGIDIRLDTDPTGAWSWEPQISSSGKNVYVTWVDDRNGWADIYFNCSTDGGATWLGTDIRLDTYPAGANDSWNPQISSYGNNVYVIWEDKRNGNWDIYFNYSTNGGATWQGTDIRLDTDPPGSSYSFNPQISSSENNVFVTWADTRNGYDGIYFNYSTDSGATWLGTDIRLDTDPTGAWSSEPQISSYGNNVFVTWKDRRTGYYDIYFNYSTDGGATWLGTDIRLDTDPTGAWSSEPQISSSENNVYVVWEDERNGYDDIYFNYFRRKHYAPMNFIKQEVLNRSLFQVEYINVLSWQSNLNNEDIVKYRIYLQSHDQTLLVELDASTFQYWHRGVEKDRIYNYFIVAVDSEGREGTPAWN